MQYKSQLQFFGLHYNYGASDDKHYSETNIGGNYFPSYKMPELDIHFKYGFKFRKFDLELGLYNYFNNPTLKYFPYTKQFATTIRQATNDNMLYSNFIHKLFNGHCRNNFSSLNVNLNYKLNNIHSVSIQGIAHFKKNRHYDGMNWLLSYRKEF